MKNACLVLVALCISFLSYGQFTSVADGNWNDGATWGNASPGTAGVDYPASATQDAIIASNVTVPGSFTAVVRDLYIQAGYTVTIANTGAVTVNGVLTIEDDGLGGNGILDIFGNLTANQGSSFVGDSPTSVIVRSTGRYIHNFTTTAGSLLQADWTSGSTCEVAGYTTNATRPANLGQAFHNFTWNCPNGAAPATFISLAGELTTVAGNLTITATGGGTRTLRLFDTSSGNIMTVGGNVLLNGSSRLVLATTGNNNSLIVTGNFTISNNAGSQHTITTTGTSNVISVTGSFLLNSTAATTVAMATVAGGSSTLNITGNFTASPTAASVINMATTATSVGAINLQGNFSMNANSTLSSTATAGSNLTFNGSSAQTFSNSGTISTRINYRVTNGAILDLQTAALIGTGTFNLAAGGTLRVGSPDGLVTGTTQGNIRVSGARTYTANGNIIYNGTTQNLGNEWSASGALNGVAVNLEISNGAVVTNNNTGSTGLVGILTLTNGTLNINTSNTLTIQGIFNSTTNGYIGGTSTSNLTFSGSGALGTLNFAPTANSLNDLTVGRSGTLVLGTDLTVNNISLSFGNLNFNGRTLTVNGSSITSSGTGLISNSSSNLVFGGSTYSGTVPFLGSSNQLNDLTFSTPGGVFNWNSHVVIQNRVTLSSGTVNHTSGLTMGSSSVFSRSGGSFLLNDPDVVTTYSVEYTGSVTTGFELPATPTELNNFTVNSSGPVTLDKDITINGNVNLLGSTFGANGFNVTLASPSGTWTRNGGGFVGGTGVLTVAGNYTIVALSSTPNYTNITINSGASLTLPLANVNIGGNIVNNGTLNRSTSTVNFNNNTTISGSSSTTLNNITVTGTLIAPAATTLGINGNFINNGTFNHNNGTVAFSGTTTISGSVASNFFHVNLTGTLTAPSATSLGIAGNWTNSGTFNHNTGTVLLNGTVAAQTVSGSSLVLNNLRVSNPVTPGVNINNTTRLNGICTLTAGAFFDADGTGAGVFIVSSSSQIAGGRIAALPTPANFTGQVTIERYVHGKTGGDYRYLAMPITTNANVGIWRNSLFVTGNFSDRNTNADNANINNSGNTNASVYTYNPATNAYVGVSGGGGLTTATAISSRIGYSVYDFNDGPVTVSYRGLPEKGSVPITISNTAARFNLVPNPYPSPIDWDNVTKTNVTDAMYIRIDNNVFSSYVGGVSTNPPFVGWTGEVAIGQAFFVVSSGSGATFTLTEASKSNNAFYFLRERTPDDYFRIKLHTSNDAQDEVVIRFAEGATDQFDSEFDAPKMWMNDDLFPFGGAKPYANMASYVASSNEAYSINTIDLLKGVKIVRLTVSDIVSGKNTLTFSELDKLTQSYNIVLVDNYLQKEYNVTDGFEHEFTVSDDKASLGSARFHLRINGAPASDIITATEGELFAGINVYPNPVVDKVTIELSAEQQNNLRSIELVSMLGVPVVNSENNKQLLNAGVKTIDMGACASGVYLLNIKVGDRVKSIRILKK